MAHHSRFPYLGLRNYRGLVSALELSSNCSAFATTMAGGKRSGRFQEKSPEQLAAARKSSMEKRKQSKKRKACECS